jgi:hypothetical protein
LWYLLKIDGRDFRVDSREFREAKWLSFGEAEDLVTDQSTLRAISLVESRRIPHAT